MRHAVKFLPVTVGHVKYVASGMRDIDAMECRIVGGGEPEEALRSAVERSDWSYALEVDGEPICIFGVAPVSLLGDVALPWMLGTDAVEKHSRIVLRHSRRWVQKMHEEYPCLCNIVHAHNDVSLRWLQWCGFKLEDVTVIEDEPFQAFSKIRVN